MEWQELDAAFAMEEVVGDATEPHFAHGTHEIRQVDVRSSADVELERALAIADEPAFAIDQRGEIRDVNELGARLAGMDRDTLIGRTFSSVVPTTHTDAIASYGGPHVRFLADAASVRVTHDGAAEPANLLVCPHDAHTTIVIVRTAPHSMPALREDDVAQIAHDLKNPLSMIALETDLLDRRLEAGEPVDVRRSVARVLRNVGYLDRMVHDLLDICSLEAGHLELRREQTELRTLVETVIDRVTAVAERGRVLLEAPDPVMIVLDDLRIERVVANFLTNALKYAPGVSGIIVRVERGPACARVSVTDAGPGMTPPEMSFIFDKYRRTRGARGCEGSGLGLYVSKQIVEAHGGMIGVDSSHGVGCRFFFELPL